MSGLEVGADFDKEKVILRIEDDSTLTLIAALSPEKAFAIAELIKNCATTLQKGKVND